MNNEQILRQILENPDLKEYWAEENTDRLNVNTVGNSSQNTFLKLVKLSLPEKNETITPRKMRNLVENIFNT